MQPRIHWKILASPTPLSARPPHQDWSKLLQTRRKELFSLRRSSTSSTSFLSPMKTTLLVMSASLQTLLGRTLLLSLLHRGNQSDPFKYALLSPWFYATGQRSQIDRTHGSRTRPGGQNPSCYPPCLPSDPYRNGGSHRSVIHRGSK